MTDTRFRRGYKGLVLEKLAQKNRPILAVWKPTKVKDKAKTDSGANTVIENGLDMGNHNLIVFG
jgi:hypothetical protein